MNLKWEKIKNHNYGFAGDSYRAKVPGGWLVVVAYAGTTFFPDPNHQWDGNSIP